MSKNKKNNQLSKDEITDYLKGSILIPDDQWEKLHQNSQISYIKNDDKFVKSGYIKHIFRKDDDGYIIYSNKINKYANDKYYKEFTVKFSNIKELYKKIDQDAIIEYKIIKNNINKFLEDNKVPNNLNERISEIETKISNLENNNIKIIKLIKKLHKLKTIDDINK